ncbi:MAG: hypothetical protein AAF658_04665 [Myxococcota bacterium]
MPKRKSLFDVGPSEVMPAASQVPKRKSLFDVGPSEVAPPVVVQPVASQVMAADRERALRALEKNLDIVARKEEEGIYDVSDDDESPAIKEKQTKFGVSRAGIGAKGASKGAAPSKHENTSVYVSGLALDASEAVLRAVMAPYGKVKHVKLYLDELDRPKGDALVTFAKPGSVRAAMAVTEVNGKRVHVAEATFFDQSALQGGTYYLDMCRPGRITRCGSQAGRSPPPRLRPRPVPLAPRPRFPRRARGGNRHGMSQIRHCALCQSREQPTGRRRRHLRRR